jgi:hypothetical protein
MSIKDNNYICKDGYSILGSCHLAIEELCMRYCMNCIVVYHILCIYTLVLHFHLYLTTITINNSIRCKSCRRRDWIIIHFIFFFWNVDCDDLILEHHIVHNISFLKRYLRSNLCSCWKVFFLNANYSHTVNIIEHIL